MADCWVNAYSQWTNQVNRNFAANDCRDLCWAPYMFCNPLLIDTKPLSLVRYQHENTNQIRLYWLWWKYVTFPTSVSMHKVHEEHESVLSEWVIIANTFYHNGNDGTERKPLSKWQRSTHTMPKGMYTWASIFNFTDRISYLHSESRWHVSRINKKTILWLYENLMNFHITAENHHTIRFDVLPAAA